MYDIKQLLLTDHKNVITFLTKTKIFAFRENHPFLNKKIFDWFLQYNNSKKIIVDNKLVGIFLLNKFQVFINNNFLSCNECSILCVENNLGMHMIRTTLKESSALSLGINRETFYPICKILKYKYGEMNRHVLILNELTYNLVKYFKLDGEISCDFFKNYVITYEDEKILPISKIDCHKLSQYFKKFINKNSFLSIDKSPEYFEWRYLNCPFYNYKIFGDDNLGYIICRIENIDVKQFKNYYVTRIIEILYLDSSKFEKLLKSFIKYCVKKDYLLIDFYFTNDFYSNLLEKFKFLKNPSFIPYIFRDHDPTGIDNLNFAYYPKFCENSSKLYIVKANVDQDLPYTFNLLSLKITDECHHQFNEILQNSNKVNLNIHATLIIINKIFKYLSLFDARLEDLQIDFISNLELNCEYNIEFSQEGNKININLQKYSKTLLKMRLKYVYIDNFESPEQNKNIDFYEFEKIIKKHDEILINLFPFIFSLDQIMSLLFISRIIDIKFPEKKGIINNLNLSFIHRNDSINNEVLISNLKEEGLLLKFNLKNIFGEVCYYYTQNNISKIGDNCKIIGELTDNIKVGRNSIICKNVSTKNYFKIIDKIKIENSIITFVSCPKTLPNNLYNINNILKEEIDYCLEKKKHISLFIGSRIAARNSLKNLNQEAYIPPIINNKFGAPIFPNWLTGSISHKNNISVAAVKIKQNDFVGIDIEYMTNSSSKLISKKILTKNEIKRESNTLLIFSFKEAIYKAIHPYLKRKIDFLEVEVEPLEKGTANIKWNLKSGEKFKTLARWMIYQDKYWFTYVSCSLN